MKIFAAYVLLFVVTASHARSQSPAKSEIARWSREARSVTITRDDWGIAHIHGRTDADAVFGLIYAQAEDDFNRVETNYFGALGRSAETEGESAIYKDLRMRLINNPDSLKALYAREPGWLKTLMRAWADGLNFYLYKHPEVKPKVITRFVPWMPLAFSDGSIGPDIESVNLTQLAAFYGAPRTVVSALVDLAVPNADRGSNGIAIAPQNTLSHHALLLINPHTSFFFRSEVQVASDQGLNAYGAVTWGQFFVYQGFNAHDGWMHSSTGADNIDEYLETVTKPDGNYVYAYGGVERPVMEETSVIRYATPHGMSEKRVTIYRTQHGPVIRAQDGKWVTIRLMQRPVDAIIQSFTRMKTSGLASFTKTLELHTNSSNNTTFADASGNIAYFHSNFIPRRDNSFDWTKPVDGSNPRTDWKGVLSISESPNSINPPNGWVFNSNNWPWSAAGTHSPKREAFPRYVEKQTEESPRGRHALMVLSEKKDFTIESLIAAAYDSYLPSFARMIPGLIIAYDALPASEPMKGELAEQIGLLRGWDYRWAANSIPTSLAEYWGDEIEARVGSEARSTEMSAETYVVERATNAERVTALAAATKKLEGDFGTWRIQWGDINRFQRITDDISPAFNDSLPSIPIPFTSSKWGSLASFGSKQYPGTKKWYGTNGNSFVAAIEFGPRVRARAVTAGGESGDPRSPHFNDEALRYASGNLRDVYFYPDQLKGHTERVYHPGNDPIFSTDRESRYRNGRTSNQPLDSSLRSELVKLGVEDQASRKGLSADTFNDTAFARRLGSEDSLRTERLRRIIRAHGWPGRSLVGNDGAQAAWLILQHSAAIDFQQSMLPTLWAAAARGEIAKAEVATLTDRVLVRTGHPQRYGTQFSMRDAHLVADPIEDPPNLERRRALVGLPKMADYAETLRRLYGMPVVWPPQP